MTSTTISFAGRAGIVTGAGNGLGRSFALALAARGAAVVVNDLGTAPDGLGASSGCADGVVEEIRAAGGRAIASYDSVAMRAGGESIVHTALETFGRVDFLINNAGILRNGCFEVLSDADIDAVLDTHLRGAFHVGQAAYRAMQKQGYGRLIFLSSGVGLFGMPFQANYAAAKGALAGLSNVLAIEGKRHGILSNAVLPIAFTRLAAAMGDDFNAEPAPDLSTLISKLTPEFVVPLVVYLASERSRCTHGLYSAVAGRYSRVFAGVTHGWYSNGAEPPAPEDIEAHLSEVEDQTRYSVPLTHFEEFLPILQHFRSVTASHRESRE